MDIQLPVQVSHRHLGHYQGAINGERMWSGLKMYSSGGEVQNSNVPPVRFPSAAEAFNFIDYLVSLNEGAWRLADFIVDPYVWTSQEEAA